MIKIYFWQFYPHLFCKNAKIIAIIIIISLSLPSSYLKQTFPKFLHYWLHHSIKKIVFKFIISKTFIVYLLLILVLHLFPTNHTQPIKIEHTNIPISSIFSLCNSFLKFSCHLIFSCSLQFHDSSLKQILGDWWLLHSYPFVLHFSISHRSHPPLLFLNLITLLIPRFISCFLHTNSNS